jgi:hypothetical protein
VLNMDLASLSCGWSISSRMHSLFKQSLPNISHVQSHWDNHSTQLAQDSDTWRPGASEKIWKGPNCVLSDARLTFHQCLRVMSTSPCPQVESPQQRTW